MVNVKGVIDYILAGIMVVLNIITIITSFISGMTWLIIPALVQIYIMVSMIFYIRYRMKGGEI